MSQPTVTLTGSIYQPRLVFSSNPMLPYVTRTAAGWETSVLSDPASRLLDGYKLVEHPLLGGEPVARLQKPLMAVHKPTGGLIVLPRLGGRQAARDLLPRAAKWRPEEGWFEIPLETARDTNPASIPRTPLADEALKRDTPKIPGWFRLQLYDFQRDAAIAAASGHRIIAEPMGLGKTRIALAAAAALNPQKTLIVTPPVMVASWQKEATASGLTRDSDPTIIVAKTRGIPLPRQGVVITTDTLLAARATLATALTGWQPDVIIVDEAHRIKNPKSKRAKTIKKLANSTPGPCYCLTGTPMLSTPVELIPLLQATRTIHWFKNTGAFLKTYTYKTPWGQNVARKKQLPKLKTILDTHVWIRHPQTIIATIPEMATQTLTVNPNLAEYRQAHSEVVDAILDWANSLPKPPNPDLIDAWCKQSLPHVSRLRVAAGRCKIPAAKDLILDWLDTHPANPDTGLFDNPLIVWCHHREVMDTLLEATPRNANFSTIRGGTSTSETASIVDNFQNGHTPLLYASIHAAGVGITLTRASHAMFVETDWTPAIIAQAQARIGRIGQTKTTISQTLVAPGTLDQAILKTLGDKAQILTPVLGEGQDVRPQDHKTDENPARVILRRLVLDTLASHGIPAAAPRGAR